MRTTRRLRRKIVIRDQPVEHGCYKYFPGVEEILDAWHERHINHHLDLLRAKAAGDEPPIDRLAAVLADYAEIQRNRTNHAASGGGGLELAAFVHRPDGATRSATQKIHQLVADLIIESASNGDIRHDLHCDELTAYCIHALDAASQMKSNAAVHLLVQLVLSAIRVPTASEYRHI